MNILALDSATEACSVALWRDGAMTERYEVPGKGHADLLLGMVDSLMSEAGLKLAELDAIAFGRGPGGFTGLRIAASLTQGLAFGAGLPVVPVSNLAALAAAAAPAVGSCKVLACLDARMGEVYWAGFLCTDGLPTALTTETLSIPAEVALPDADSGWLGVGHGFAAHPALQERLAARLGRVDAERLPRALSIARIAAVEFKAGRRVAAEQALPVYLRDDVVHKRPVA